MLKEALEKLETLANAAHGVHAKSLSGVGEPTDYLLFGPNGFEIRTPAPKPRNHVAADLTAVCALARQWRDDGGNGAEIWYSRDATVVLLDREARRERVTFKLNYSKPMGILIEWDRCSPQLDQKQLIRTLRTTFPQCLQKAPGLLGVLQKLRWSSSAEAEVEVRSGRASVGRQIQAQVSGTGELPELFTLTVPVFLQASCPWAFEVDVALEPIPEGEKFLLTPLAGSVERAISLAESELESAITELLDGAAVPCFYGRVD